MINLLGNTPNQPSKFKTKSWVEINNESRETYNEDYQIRFKLQYSSQINLIMTIYICLLKEL